MIHYINEETCFSNYRCRSNGIRFFLFIRHRFECILVVIQLSTLVNIDRDENFCQHGKKNILTNNGHKKKKKKKWFNWIENTEFAFLPPFFISRYVEDTTFYIEMSCSVSTQKFWWTITTHLTCNFGMLCLTKR
jgi:hypothetical protein